MKTQITFSKLMSSTEDKEAPDFVLDESSLKKHGLKRINVKLEALAALEQKPKCEFIEKGLVSVSGHLSAAKLRK